MSKNENEYQNGTRIHKDFDSFRSLLCYNASNLTIRHESGEWLYAEIAFASIELLTIEDCPLVSI